MKFSCSGDSGSAPMTARHTIRLTALYHFFRSSKTCRRFTRPCFCGLILAVIIATSLVLPFSSGAVEPDWSVIEGTTQYMVNLGDKVNVLRDNGGLIYSVANIVDNIDIITDGVHFGYGKYPRVFYNKKVFDNKDAAKTAEEAPGVYEFKLADGTTNAYYYYISWENVNADVASFDIYFSGEDAYNTTGLHLPNYQIDAEFDILVSSDNGETWNVAWQSVRFETDPNDPEKVVSMAGFTENEGKGNAVEVKITDPADPHTVLTTYRYISGEFNQTYENVTNVVYAVSRIRRDGQTIDEKDKYGYLVERTYLLKAIPQCYACRISEFQVFGTKLDTPPHRHSFGTAWKMDESKHWRVCSCGEESQFAAHSFGKWTVTKAATEQAAGTEYRSCTVCGYREERSIPVLVHTHKYGTEWQSDTVRHWHSCSCGEKSQFGAHSFGNWVVTREATEQAAGTEYRICSVCGYREDHTIPKSELSTETTAAPVTTAKPVTTAVPSATDSPESTQAPASSASPETTSEPVTTPMPDTTGAPDTTGTPDTAKSPDTSYQTGDNPGETTQAPGTEAPAGKGCHSVASAGIAFPVILLGAAMRKKKD